MSFIYHASVRLCSRYPGAGITVPYLKKQFESGNFLRRIRTAPNRWKFWTNTPDNLEIVAVYDTDVKHVITVLPPEDIPTDLPKSSSLPHLSGLQLDYLMGVIN